MDPRHFIGGSYEFEENGVRLLDAQSLFFLCYRHHTGHVNENGWTGIRICGNDVRRFERGTPGWQKTLSDSYATQYSRQRLLVAFTAYDNETRSMLQTDQQYPAVERK